MNSKSLSEKCKSCSACKRKLPLYLYGVRQLSKDGYSNRCRECRNFKRRKAKQSPGVQEEAIMPLSEHNKAFLESLNRSPRLIELVGIDLKNFESVQISSKRTFKNCRFFVIQFKSGCSKGIIAGDDYNVFTAMALKLLHAESIRLFYPWDYYSMANWGLAASELPQATSLSKFFTPTTI